MKQKSRGLNEAVGKRTCIGVLVCIVGMILGISVSAILIERELVAAERAGYCVMTAVMLSAFAGAMTATRGMKSGKLSVCALTALGYFAVLLSLTALVFDGEYAGVAANCMLSLCGCVVTVFLGTKDKKQTFSMKSKNKHRRFVQNHKAGK